MWDKCAVGKLGQLFQQFLWVWDCYRIVSEKTYAC